MKYEDKKEKKDIVFGKHKLNAFERPGKDKCPESACEITVEETSAKTEDKNSSKCRILPSNFIL